MVRETWRWGSFWYAILEFFTVYSENWNKISGWFNIELQIFHAESIDWLKLARKCAIFVLLNFKFVCFRSLPPLPAALLLPKKLDS